MDRRQFISNTSVCAAAGLIIPVGFSSHKTSASKLVSDDSFVRISSKNPFYFELSNGETYIPIGANLCWARDMNEMESYFRKLSENGGNYARVWLNHPQHEIELEYGKLNPVNLSNIERIVDFAKTYKIKVKFCIESFRKISTTRDFFSKPQYHTENGGPFSDMNEYIQSENGRKAYLSRLEVFRNKFGDHPAIFGWELWNEMNAIDSEGVLEWNENMLPRVHAMFPSNLVLQSLGSFDNEGARTIYRKINQLPSNDVAQIHRYLDLGASLDICKAPMDMLAADAIDELRSYQVQKPMLLAEVGGVKPKHTGPIELYEKDMEGTLLHDLLFAPFFRGAAGPGHAWHWDRYIDKNNLWFHFRRFSECLKGIDPIRESFIPLKLWGKRVRSYLLAGNSTVLAWCRDGENNWQTELAEGIPPQEVKNYTLNLSSLIKDQHIALAEVYDPWLDKWLELPKKSIVNIPAFRRSVVLRIHKKL